MDQHTVVFDGLNHGRKSFVFDILEEGAVQDSNDQPACCNDERKVDVAQHVVRIGSKKEFVELRFEEGHDKVEDDNSAADRYAENGRAENQSVVVVTIVRNPAQLVGATDIEGPRDFGKLIQVSL